jgi:uncharacterized protein (DUF302 family)
MSSEPVISTYVIPEPIERALKLLRQALADRGLTVLGEHDLAARIQRELGVRMNPARILYVDSPGVLIETMTLFPPAAALLPLHVVVIAQGAQTEVHVLGPSNLSVPGIPAPARAPISRLQSEMTGALLKIAMRQGVCG